MARTASTNKFAVSFHVRDMRAPDAAPTAKTVIVQAPHPAGALESAYREHTGAGYQVVCPVTVADAPAADAAPARGKK